jgi:hypothetical protein
VVARGKVTAAKLRRALRANACVRVLPIGFNSAAPSFPSSGSVGGARADGMGAAVVSAAKGVVEKGRALGESTKEALEDPAPLSTFLLVVVGLLTLMGAALGGFLLVSVLRLRERL